MPHNVLYNKIRYNIITIDISVNKTNKVKMKEIPVKKIKD